MTSDDGNGDEQEQFVEDFTKPTPADAGGYNNPDQAEKEFQVGVTVIVGIFLAIMTIYGLYISNFQFAAFSMALIVILTLGSRSIN